MLTLLRDLRRLRRDTALPRPDRGRSLAIRHVDAGSCNACEQELTATAAPQYDLQRFGLDVVAYAAVDNLLPDFPLINKSFELCYACADR